MSRGCTQCGGDYIFIEATPEILENTEGAYEFVETVRSFGGLSIDITLGYCLNCKEQVLRGPVMTFEGTINDSSGP